MLTDYLSQITREDVQRFLNEHENDDENELVLKKKLIFEIPSSILATQLAGRKKAKAKLPTWYNTKGIVYPPSINLEQCSSEATAVFKTQAISSIILCKNVAADVTGGLGVDTLYLSKVFKEVHYVEPNPELFEIARHNHHLLGARNIIHHNTSAENFIRQGIKADFIFIDPSRRDMKSRKLYKLADCSPDITLFQQSLFKASSFLLVKASPLLDITQAIGEIKHVKKVFVVSLKNECKELLFLAENNYAEDPQVDAVELIENGNCRSVFSFGMQSEKEVIVQNGEPEEYIFEPNAAIMKTGAFKLVAARFKLTKLSVNTHLYTSPHPVQDFPGRTFRVEKLDPNEKELKSAVPDGKVNVISRNYPLSADGIKKKFHLHDGGQKFLIGFSGTTKKHLALCSQLTKI